VSGSVRTRAAGGIAAAARKARTSASSPAGNGHPRAGNDASDSDRPTWSQPATMNPPPLNDLSQVGLDLGESTDSVAPASSPAAAGEYTPEAALDEQIRDLESWALAILRRRRRELARFWVVRGLAFCSAAVATALALKGIATPAVVLSAVAAFLVAVDVGWPGAASRAPHRRAIYDLRETQSAVKLRWQKVRLAHPDPTSRKRVAHAVELLELIHAKREAVGEYLGSFESNRGVNRSG